ncbi:hypothetical protein KSP39_PZI007507 [Platanthera zijinensis]|uniref:Uncharacterized protein n=1 Tax=Platanthera zijinensis TaxID=2320716 RepID=A0AAP0BQ51_9ASPA
MAQPTAKCEDCGAFIKRFILCPPSPALPPSPPLPLHGLTFAVKDMSAPPCLVRDSQSKGGQLCLSISCARFDMEGHVTGFGNPDWARTHVPATSTAPTVLALLEAGHLCW